MNTEDKKGIQGAVKFISSIGDANKSAFICLAEAGNDLVCGLGLKPHVTGGMLFSACKTEKGGSNFTNEMLEAVSALIIEDPSKLDTLMSKIEEMKNFFAPKQHRRRYRNRPRKKGGNNNADRG